jgi:hypothetical protein
MKAVEKMGRRWLTALVLGLASRILIAKAFKVIHHRKVVQPQAASAIQRRWRDWHRKRVELQMRAMSLIVRQMMRRRAVKRRHRSCDIIVTMLNETAFLSKINRAIRRFRLYVVMVQRHVKAWLECCRNEKRTLLKLVEKAEKVELMAAVKAKRLALRSEREEYEKDQMSKDFTSPALSRPTDMFEGNEPYQVVHWPQLQVPAQVRARIVQETCLRRRKQYVLDLHSYDEERKRFKMLRQQFIMFTARVHQFAQDVKGTDSHEEGDKVSKIVLHELDHLSQRGDSSEGGSSSKAGMPKEQAELLKKLSIPNRPQYPRGLDDAEAQALARQGMEASGSTMLESLSTWYREKCEAAETRKAAAARGSNEGATSPRSATSPTPRRTVLGRNTSPISTSAAEGRVMPIPRKIL